MANEIARRLRKTMTPQEVKLWVHLRAWRKLGFHFRRQSPVDGYILDFICLKSKLVIEIDGGQHGQSTQVAKDAIRDRHLACNGYRVLRFWNSDVDQNLPGVLQAIEAALKHPTRLADGQPPSP